MEVEEETLLMFELKPKMSLLLLLRFESAGMGVCSPVTRVKGPHHPRRDESCCQECLLLWWRSLDQHDIIHLDTQSLSSSWHKWLQALMVLITSHWVPEAGNNLTQHSHRNVHWALSCQADGDVSQFVLCGWVDVASCIKLYPAVSSCPAPCVVTLLCRPRPSSQQSSSSLASPSCALTHNPVTFCREWELCLWSHCFPDLGCCFLDLAASSSEYCASNVAVVVLLLLLVCLLYSTGLVYNCAEKTTN